MNKNNLGDVRYAIDHDRRILYAERHDDLTKEGIYAEWQAMRLLDGFDPAYDTIVDYSRVPVVDLDAAEIMEINKAIPDLDPRTGHVAIVSGLQYGRYLLARFFCTVSSSIANRKHQVFNSRAEAEVWISALREKRE